jgi:Pre-toxin TG
VSPITAARFHRLAFLCRTFAVICLVLFLFTLFQAPPAAADNCSFFADCFNQAGSANEAGFAALFFTGLSIALDFTPIVGDVKGVIEAITGYDVITGDKLEPWERALGLVPFLPSVHGLTKGAGLVGDLARHGDEVGDVLGAVSRHGDDVTDLARRGDDVADISRSGESAADGVGDATRHTNGAPPLTPVTPKAPTTPTAPVVRNYPPPGSVVPSSKNTDALALQYKNVPPGAGRTTARTALAEEIGESGAVDYLNHALGGNITSVRSTPSAVSGYARRVADGVPWDHAITYKGKGVTNVVYWDGSVMHVIEAKGGSSQIGTRVINGADTRQDTPAYLKDIYKAMQKSNITDGRREIGKAIEAAGLNLTINHLVVRTGPYTQLVKGSATVKVMTQVSSPPPTP